mmetsp:Transcript_37987/g.74234  ORF Transcript_37987/g.74234 Transcript_37987/m.74234 type:complete len:204 (-) Transcript_37987:178-789(-)
MARHTSFLLRNFSPSGPTQYECELSPLIILYPMVLSSSGAKSGAFVLARMRLRLSAMRFDVSSMTFSSSSILLSSSSILAWYTSTCWFSCDCRSSISARTETLGRDTSLTLILSRSFSSRSRSSCFFWYDILFSQSRLNCSFSLSSSFTTFRRCCSAFSSSGLGSTLMWSGSDVRNVDMVPCPAPHRPAPALSPLSPPRELFR